MQVWQTPFYSEEFADKQPPRNGFYGRIGNADLVRWDLQKFYMSPKKLKVAKFPSLVMSNLANNQKAY